MFVSARLLSLVVVLGAIGAAGQGSPDCRSERFVPASNTQTYTITSPGYPNNYPPNFECFWYFFTDPGSVFKLTCSEVDMVGGYPCTDYLRAYGTDKDFDICRPFQAHGKTEKLLFKLQTSNSTKGGSFSCTVQVKPKHCECGWKYGTKVVGGNVTEENEIPCLAAIVHAKWGDQMCGATIVSQRYVLTAAHCLEILTVETTGVLVGAHNLTNLTEPDVKLHRIKRFIPHPNWHEGNVKNDIALVEVIEPIKFTLRVGPVCLPFHSPSLPELDEEVKVVGWGTIAFGGPKSDVPMKADLRVVPIDRCQKSFSTKNVLPDTQFCTFTRGKDACQMDSGGPLLRTNLSHYYLTGVVSYGGGCASEDPAVNTRVTGYLDWIKSATGDEKFCIK